MDAVTLLSGSMQYRIEYMINPKPKSANNKAVKNKATIIPFGTSAVAQFIDECCVVGIDQKVEYMELYMYFREKCIEPTTIPEIDLPLFEKRMMDRLYQVKHQLASRLKSDQEIKEEVRERAIEHIVTDVQKQGMFWRGIGTKKNNDFELHLPDGFMEFEADNDDAAYEYLCTRPEFNLDDDRPIAGKNYLRFSRPKFWLRK